MTLKSQIAADVDLVLYNTDDFATQISYEVRDNETTLETIEGKAIVNKGKRFGPSQNHEGTLEIPKTFVSQPKAGDLFTDEDSQVWRIVRVIRSDEYDSICETRRDQRLTAKIKQR